MIKKLKLNLRGVGIHRIHYTATKNTETRNKILALASIRDSQEIAKSFPIKFTL